MSAFGVKTPLLKAVITHNFRFDSSQDICNMLQSRFGSDNQKKYSVIDTADILSLRPEATAIPIKGSRSFHMCFRPDGSILCKVNICSCNFLECAIEPGKLFSAEGKDYDDSDIEFEDEDAFGDEIEDSTEKYEMHSDSVLEVLSVGDVIALFSSSMSLELFIYAKLWISVWQKKIWRMKTIIVLRRVLLTLKSNNVKKPSIVYKCLPKPVYVHPAHVSPKVNVTLGSDIHVSWDEYQYEMYQYEMSTRWVQALW